MKKLLKDAEIVAVLLNNRGIVYRGIDILYSSNISRYLKEERDIKITHCSKSIRPLFNYWLKSYGLVSWCVTASVHPSVFGLKITG